MQLRTAATILSLIFTLSMSIPAAALGQSVTVNWADQRQTIDGFGAEWGWRCHNPTPTAMSDAAHDLLFSPTSGIGLSMLRTRISEDSTEWPCMMSDLQAFLARIHQRNPAVPVWAAVWTIPAAYVTGNVLDPAHYQDYANYLSLYIRTLAGYGITLYGVSIQNEPDGGGDQQWNGQMIHDFIKNNLAPTFQRDGVTTRIMLPETVEWQDLPYADVTLNDASTAAAVSIVASHDYGGSYGMGAYGPYALAKTLGKQLWETEVSRFGGCCFDASMQDGIGWASSVHAALTNAEVTAWHYWQLVQDQSANENDNAGLVAGGIAGASPDPPFVLQTTKRTFTLGNFSKFLRPGWVRVTTNTAACSYLLCSAYKNPATGDFAVVVINNSGNSPAVTVTLSGVSTITTPVQPWVTSASADLQLQSPVTASGASFTATLAPLSVTTFSGRGSTTPVDTTPPTPPTALIVR